MMHVLQTGIVLVLFFAILIFFHELGHFLAAKACRMKVLEFAFGFGKRVCRFGFDGETEYTLRALPMGGFVRIAGMETEDEPEEKSNDAEADRGALLESTNEHLLHQEAEEVAGIDPNGYNSRPLRQRFAVILAGPVFSFLLGWLVLCLVGLIAGFPLFRIDGVTANSVASRAGLHAGDTILTIDGAKVDVGTAMDKINDSLGRPIQLSVRDAAGTQRIVEVTPASSKLPGDAAPVGRIGVTPGNSPSTTRVGLADSFERGTVMTENWFRTMAALFRTGAIKDNVGGVITIAKATGEATKAGPSDLLLELGTLSLSLGLFNLLPIPVLDGGHLMLMAVELVRGRKLNAAQTYKVTLAGMAIIGLLFVSVLLHDVVGLFPHH